jgi:membrane-associated phospholipid phosphatase
MKRLILIVLIFFIFSLSIRAEEKKDSLIIKKVFLHGIDDSKKWVLSPIKWDGKDWLLFGGVSAATGALIVWGDQPVYNFANTIHNPFLNKLSPYIEPFGHYYLFAAISGTLIQGLITKNNYSVETSLIAGESFLFNTLMVQIVKNTLCRTRPNDLGTTNPHQWNGPFFKGNSFFSGHTSAAFSVASVYAYRYRETVWVPVVSYGLASLIGLQRIYSNRHWASDVLFGAAAGTATGIFLCKQWEKSPIRFYPVFSKEYSGLSLIIPIEERVKTLQDNGF